MGTLFVNAQILPRQFLGYMSTCPWVFSNFLPLLQFWQTCFYINFSVRHYIEKLLYFLLRPQVKKRTRDLSTPTKKYSTDYKPSKGFQSAPQDFGNHKRRLQFDNGSPNWSRRSNRRGGWIPDDSDDFQHHNGWSAWRSPSTPNKKHKIYGLTEGGQGSNSQSSKRWGKSNSGTSSSKGYANSYQHRFSASRFGNSSNDGMRRNHDWWQLV